MLSLQSVTLHLECCSNGPRKGQDLKWLAILDSRHCVWTGVGDPHIPAQWVCRFMLGHHQDFPPSLL